MRLDEMWNQAQAGVRGRAAAPGPVQPSPVMVQVQDGVWGCGKHVIGSFQALTDMGFPRQRVEQALTRTNNDMDQATNFLLQDMQGSWVMS